MSHHVFCYPHIVVDLAIVHLKDEADKVGQDGGATGLRLDRRRTFARLCSDDGKTGGCQYTVS